MCNGTGDCAPALGSGGVGMADINRLGHDGSVLSRAYERVLIKSDEVREAATRFRDDRDSDEDGAVSGDEFGNLQRAAAVDRSSEGTVDEKEIRRMFSTESKLRTQARMVARIFANRDVDGDGVLSETELSAADGRHGKLDRDSDGSLTPAELRRALKKAVEIEEALDAASAGGSGTKVSTGGSGGDGLRTGPGQKRNFLFDVFGETELGRIEQRYRIGESEKGPGRDDEPPSALEKGPGFSRRA